MSTFFGLLIGVRNLIIEKIRTKLFPGVIEVIRRIFICRTYAIIRHFVSKFVRQSDLHNMIWLLCAVASNSEATPISFPEPALPLCSGTGNEDKGLGSERGTLPTLPGT